MGLKVRQVSKRVQESSYIFMVENKLSEIFLKVNGNTRHIIKKGIEI